jgi:hypothetical protein
MALIREFTYTNISTNTTTTVFTGKGFLHSIVVNTTAAGSIKIIDNTTGTTANVGTLKASVAEGTYLYDVAISAGLIIITAGASDITVAWSQ